MNRNSKTRFYVRKKGHSTIYWCELSATTYHAAMQGSDTPGPYKIMAKVTFTQTGDKKAPTVSKTHASLERILLECEIVTCDALCGSSDPIKWSLSLTMEKRVYDFWEKLADACKAEESQCDCTSCTMVPDLEPSQQAN